MSNSQKFKTKNKDDSSVNAAVSAKDKKNASKPRKDERDFRKKTDAKGVPNDISWYSADPELLVKSASLPWSERLGDKFVINDKTTVRFPGVCALHFAPTIGVATTSDDAVNITARAIYTEVRSWNSGSANYEEQDIMIYLLAMGELFSFHNFLTRLYTVARSYNPYNMYQPRALVEAMGVNFDDIVLHLADLNYYLSYTASQINRMAVPKLFYYIARRSWMNSNVFKDSDAAKAQLYMYVQEFYWQYSPYSNRKGGELSTKYFFPWQNDTSMKQYNDIRYTYEQLVQYFNSMIVPVVDDEDMGIISGDLLKTYGANAMYYVTGIDPNTVYEPSFEPTMLTQLENAVLIGPVAANTNWKVTQDPTTHTLRFNPTWTVDFSENDRYCSTQVTGPKLLNLPVPIDDISPSVTMIATRLTPTVEYVLEEEAPTASHRITSCGSEVLLYGMLFELNAVGAITKVPFSSFISTADSRFDRVTGLIDKFSFHPMLYAYVDDIPDVGAGIHGPIDTYTVASPALLKKMHDTAIWSEFSVPAIQLWKVAGKR